MRNILSERGTKENPNTELGTFIFFKYLFDVDMSIFADEAVEGSKKKTGKPGLGWLAAGKAAKSTTEHAGLNIGLQPNGT